MKKAISLSIIALLSLITWSYGSPYVSEVNWTLDEMGVSSSPVASFVISEGVNGSIYDPFFIGTRYCRF